MNTSKSQSAKIFSILEDKNPHSADELINLVYHNVRRQRLGARIHDLNEKLMGTMQKIIGYWDNHDRNVYWYRLINREPHQKVINF